MTKNPVTRPPVFRSKASALFGLLGLLVFCAVLLMTEALVELAGYEEVLEGFGHQYLEFAVVVALALGIGLTAREIRKVLQRHKRMEKTLEAASGAFYQVIEDHFDAWALTPSERDVALLAIKGLSIAEIAQARNTKEGTIKAQCNATYRKAGVTGRTQLLSLFIEELLGEGLSGRRDQPAVPEQRQPDPDAASAFSATKMAIK